MKKLSYIFTFFFFFSCTNNSPEFEIFEVSYFEKSIKLNSEKIIELSTLTGACIVALGTDVAGSISNNDELYQAVFKESLETGESIWRLPIVKPLEDAVKGTFGDLKNSIPGGAGAITAGIFLTHFVEDNPFLHLDIAGVSYGKKRKYYSEKRYQRPLQFPEVD